MPIDSIAKGKKHTLQKSNELRGEGPRFWFQLPPPPFCSRGCELGHFSSSLRSLSFFS